MTTLNPEYEGKFGDLWWVIPSLVGMNPFLFWFLQLVLGLIIMWIIYFSGWLL